MKQNFIVWFFVEKPVQQCREMLGLEMNVTVKSRYIGHCYVYSRHTVHGRGQLWFNNHLIHTRRILQHTPKPVIGELVLLHRNAHCVLKIEAPSPCNTYSTLECRSPWTVQTSASDDVITVVVEWWPMWYHTRIGTVPTEGPHITSWWSLA
jgi:hypothetical protein